MKATRRTVLGWLLAVCIAPPRFEDVRVHLDGIKTMQEYLLQCHIENFIRRMELTLVCGPEVDVRDMKGARHVRLRSSYALTYDGSGAGSTNER